MQKVTPFVVAGLTAAMLFCVAASVARADVADCHDATCRLTVQDGQGRSMGTGCVYQIADGHVFVLTNAHVATSKVVHCEFWRSGHKSAFLAGETVLRNTTIDAAVVAVPVGSFGGVLPKIVPLAEPSYRMQPGQTVYSVGCAKGAWATAWTGHFIRYEGNGYRNVRFTPMPANGRSGSAVFDASGKQIVALIMGRTDEEGVAVSIEAVHQALDIYRAFNGSEPPQTTNAGECEQTQCYGGVCPTCPTCPSRPQPYYERPAPQPTPAPRQNSGPWPTLPKVDVTPDSEAACLPRLLPQPRQAPRTQPVPDNRGIERKLDVLIDLQSRPAPLPQQSAEAQKPEPEPEPEVGGIGLLLTAFGALVVGVLLFYVAGQN